MEKQKSTQRDSLRENRCRINAEVDRVVGWTAGITWGVYGVKDKDLCPYFPAKRLVSRAEDESGRHKTVLSLVFAARENPIPGSEGYVRSRLRCTALHWVALRCTALPAECGPERVPVRSPMARLSKNHSP